MENNHFEELKRRGFTVVDRLISDQWIETLSTCVDQTFYQHRKIQAANNSDIKTDGVALHALLSDDTFLEFLQHLIDINFIQNLSKHFFNANCILNSFSVLNNLPDVTNFSANVHRDLRFYSHNLPCMVNCLLMIDDFTSENGGTLLLPYSHLEEVRPSEDVWANNLIQITGGKGSMLVFDSNVWHASAPNRSGLSRRAIPITISRSFLKQLLDYPRALGYDRMGSFSEELQQFLGYHSRVPASLEEWYRPESERFYKKYQD